ncbi:sugar-binding protein, partial [bacterium]
EIDGVLDEAWKDQSAAYSAGNLVYNSDDIVGGFTELATWNDCYMNFRIMFDACFLYLWCDVIDDELDASGPNYWENDGITLFINVLDNTNVDPPQFFPDPVIWNWVWNSMESGIQGGHETVAWGEQEPSGYSFETAIPIQDLPFTLQEENEIGFEVLVRDRDHQVRENMMTWWGGDSELWEDPSQYGTITLGWVLCGDPIPCPSTSIGQAESDLNFFLDSKLSQSL